MEMHPNVSVTTINKSGLKGLAERQKIIQL